MVRFLREKQLLVWSDLSAGAVTVELWHSRYSLDKGNFDQFLDHFFHSLQNLQEKTRVKD